MKKLLVYLDEDFHADLKELARRKNTSMGALVRYAVDLTFEDDLDIIAGDRGLEEMLADPSSTMTLDEYLKSRGIELPDYSPSSGPEGTRKIAEERSRTYRSGDEADAG